MSSTMEKIDANKVKMTFKVSPDKFEEGVQKAYNKNKSKLNIPGFRKGKAPRKLIEAQFGKEIFYDDAANFVLPDAYDSAVAELDLEIVSKPEIDIEKIDEDGVVFTAEVFIKPEVVIENYKGINYTKHDKEVTEDELNAEIDKTREKNSRMITVTDRPVQDGDIATIDFEGFIDDVAFEGGKGADHDLTIGSHSFIDDFEEQLIGSNVGDDLDVSVTFPEDYHSEELKGKEALFKVEIKDIKYKELPEFDDDFVQDVSEFDTVDEYKNDIKAKLQADKDKQIEAEIEQELLGKLVEAAEMDVPEVMIENEIDNSVNSFRNNISRHGLTLDVYLQYMGQTMESMRDAFKAEAESNVKGRLALEAIAKKEGFKATDEEIDAEITRISEAYGMDKESLLSTLRPEDKKSLSQDVEVQKAIKLVKDNAVAI